MYEDMKEWFGHGEVDVDLMIRMGALTPTQLVRLVVGFIDSPWYGWAL
jgi:hypothetical protein